MGNCIDYERTSEAYVHTLIGQLSIYFIFIEQDSDTRRHRELAQGLLNHSINRILSLNVREHCEIVRRGLGVEKNYSQLNKELVNRFMHRR